VAGWPRGLRVGSRFRARLRASDYREPSDTPTGCERHSPDLIAAVAALAPVALAEALVAMAAACFVFAGLYGFAGLDPAVARDSVRIAAQVVTGVGFLGADTILRAEHSVFGLTTATLWFAAGQGIRIAAGLIWLAVFATAMVFPLLGVVGKIEDWRELTGADRALKA
jgi:hypothetical protein